MSRVNTPGGTEAAVSARLHLTFRWIYQTGWRFLGRWSSADPMEVEALWERLPHEHHPGRYAVDFCDGAGNVLIIKYVDASVVESVLGASVEDLWQRTSELLR